MRRHLRAGRGVAWYRLIGLDRDGVVVSGEYELLLSNL